MASGRTAPLSEVPLLIYLGVRKLCRKSVNLMWCGKVSSNLRSSIFRIDKVEDCGETKGEVSVVLDVREVSISGHAGAYSGPYASLPGWNNRVRICAVVTVLGFM